MPAFAVSAVDRMGIRRSLREAAPDVPTLRANLRAQALWPVRIRVVPDTKLSRLRVPTREFVGLLHQLELQLRAGVTADTALAELAADTPDGAMRAMLEHVHRQVAQGVPIHAACRFFSRQFPAHLAAVIAAGEASARLPEALHALAQHLTSVDELRRTARRAMIYPAIVLGATAALVIFLLGGVVPQFAEIFTSLHLALPWVTVALIRASDFVRHDWALLMAMTTAAGMTAWLAARMNGLRRWRDTIVLRLPIIGDTVRHLATTRFAVHCRLLHEAGIPMLDALATGAELAGNAVLARQLLIAREGVAAGQPLFASLPKPNAFPAFFVPALKAGETTGQLGAALRLIENYAGCRARERIATALALLEPVLLAILTVVVGTIALSFFLPVFSLLGGVNAR